MKSCEKLWKVVKRCEKLCKVVKSCEKLRKIVKSCEQLWKVKTSGEKLPKVVKTVKSCQKLWKVMKSNMKLWKVGKNWKIAGLLSIYYLDYFVAIISSIVSWVFTLPNTMDLPPFILKWIPTESDLLCRTF